VIQVKICGITNIDDAIMAAELGAHALGFIFAQSPRNINPEKAREIICQLPPFVQTVGVFINEDAGKIREIVEYCALDLVQLHGDESVEVCSRLMPRVIKVIRIKDRTSLLPIQHYNGNVRAILLDTWSAEARGGTGRGFDWDLAVEAKQFGIPIVLSGGLKPANIKEAIARVKPVAVDVNSGVEARAGKKSLALLEQFFNEIRGYGG